MRNLSKRRSRVSNLSFHFAAIDFETANTNHSSICAVGVVVVRNNELAESFYSLVKPTPNYYSYLCYTVHGLSHSDTDNAEDFPTVWAKVSNYIAGLPLVAHCKHFDENCLKAAFLTYNMNYPDYEFYCTYQATRRALPDLQDHRLPTVSAACGYDLKQHHHALADAEACAWIARKIL